MKKALRTLPVPATLVLMVLLAAAGPAMAQETTDHSGADKAAQPATSPAAEPAAEPATEPVAAPASADGPRVAMAFGTGIDRETRQVVGEAAAFAGGDTVWCRTVLENLAYPTTVTHAWYHEGRTLARVELNVGSAHWRTWSSKIILPEQTGAWEVKVLNADGTVLGAGTFAIE